MFSAVMANLNAPTGRPLDFDSPDSNAFDKSIFVEEVLALVAFSFSAFMIGLQLKQLKNSGVLFINTSMIRAIRSVNMRKSNQSQVRIVEFKVYVPQLAISVQDHTK